jgi:hypothetical protein
VAQAERIAYCNNEIADFHIARIANGKFDKVPGFDLDYRDVGRGVRSHDLGIEGLIIESRDLNSVGVLDDMMIGQDVAVRRVDDDARAGALDLTRSARHLRETEKSPEHFIAIRRSALDCLADPDIYHGRSYAFDQGSKARYRLTLDIVG